MINNRENGRLRLSLRKGGISSRIDTTITGQEGIMWINQGLTVLKSSVQCSES